MRQFISFLGGFGLNWCMSDAGVMRGLELSNDKESAVPGTAAAADAPPRQSVLKRLKQADPIPAPSKAGPNKTAVAGPPVAAASQPSSPMPTKAAAAAATMPKCV